MSANPNLVRSIEICRLCAAPLSEILASFPSLPVAGTYADPAGPADDAVFPLTLVHCRHCGLTQLKESLSPEFYKCYRFLSGVADGYRQHLAAIASDLGRHLPLGASVVEIGASDGTLLKLLQQQALQVAGFEPASEPSSLARQKQLPIVETFFNPETAALCPLQSVDLVILRHVLEHIDDFQAIFEGLETLISPEGTLLIEVPDFRSTVELSIYSNIYHLHPCYFDLAAMSRLLLRYGWRLAGSRIVDVFGGSLFLWANRTGRAQFSFPSVPGRPARAVEPSQVTSFVAAWRNGISATRNFFDELRRSGADVAGYGAAERTAALVGTAGLDSSHIAAIYDRNPMLEGLALPGSRIPIRSPRQIMADRPDYLVIFARSFEDEVIRELDDFRASGGQFVSTRMVPPALITVGGKPVPRFTPGVQ